MNETWELVVKELSVYGVKLIDEQRCQVDGQTMAIARVIVRFKKKVNREKAAFKFLWRQAAKILNDPTTEPCSSTDRRLKNLFIFSVKNLANVVDIFEELDNSTLKKIIQYNLSRDITEFNPEQVKKLPDFAIAIDWTFRKINKYGYIIHLLRFASSGRVYVNSLQVKTAAGAASDKGFGGPWGNLDLPMLERVWPWQDEDENFRGRDKDIRNQRRYRMGLEHYNGDGSVGEGYYWREIRNEPFSWYNREDDDPYYQRYLLTHN